MLCAYQTMCLYSLICPSGALGLYSSSPQMSRVAVFNDTASHN